MVFTKYQIYLSILLLLTGIINSSTWYWANHAATVYRSDWQYGPRKFGHPFVLMWVMFFGETLCLVSYKILRAYYARNSHQSIVAGEDARIIRGNRDFNPFIFLPPALLDMLATSLMSIGVEMKVSYAADCQMWRGVAVVLVAYLSRRYIGRATEKKERRGVEIMFLGFLVIALGSRDRIQNGDKLILLAQIILACQMVYEEKYVVAKDISPLQAAGWEGIFGFLVLGALLIPLYFAGIEDVPKALDEIAHNWQLPIGLTVIAINIAVFNFAGLAITKELSATHRMVLDSLRSLWIPIASNSIQMIGVVIVLRGMIYFYEIPLCDRKAERSLKRADNDAVDKREAENNARTIEEA